METLPQYGNNQNGEKVNELQKELLDTSLLKCRDVLGEAFRIAKQNRDVEALVIISDRWARLAAEIKGIDKGSNFMLGFTHNLEKDDEDE
jgi:hypothetical protein